MALAVRRGAGESRLREGREVHAEPPVQAEELRPCPNSSRELWKDLEKGRAEEPLDLLVDSGRERGERSPVGTDCPRPSNQVASLGPVTPVDGGGGSGGGSGGGGGSGTWGRSGPPKKEELVGGKKKGRTWGPSSTLQKERAGGEER